MDQPNKPAAMAVEVTGDGVTAYMNRAAIFTLIEDLQRVAAADPAGCFEIHLGMLFSRFDANGQLRWPPVAFGDDIGAMVQSRREETLKKAIAAGEIDRDAALAPFEITLMHAPSSAFQQIESRAKAVL